MWKKLKFTMINWFVRTFEEPVRPSGEFRVTVHRNGAVTIHVEEWLATPEGQQYLKECSERFRDYKKLVRKGECCGKCSH